MSHAVNPSSHLDAMMTFFGLVNNTLSFPVIVSIRSYMCCPRSVFCNGGLIVTSSPFDEVSVDGPIATILRRLDSIDEALLEEKYDVRFVEHSAKSCRISEPTRHSIPLYCLAALAGNLAILQSYHTRQKAKKGPLQRARELFYTKEPKIFASSMYGKSPVHYAACHHRADVLDFLLNLPKEDCDLGSNCVSPLMLACTYNSLSCAKLLHSTNPLVLSGGAFLNQTTSALLKAASMGHDTIIRWLVSISPEIIHEKDGNGWNALLHATSGRHLSTIKLLLSQNSSCINVYSKSRETALSIASSNGWMELVKYFLQVQPLLMYVRNDKGQNPCWVACSQRQEEVVMHFISLDVELAFEKVNKGEGECVLLKACELGLRKVVRQLLKVVPASKFITEVTHRGSNGFMIACSQNHIDMVKDIADVIPLIVTSRSICEEWTPLTIASSQGNLDLVKVIVSINPVTMHQPGSMGLTPLLWGAWCGHVDVVDYFIQVDPNVLTQQRSVTTQQNVLSIAVMNKQVSVVELLMSHCGPIVFAKLASETDREGASALTWATRKKNVLLQKLLETSLSAIA
eukprot:PhF_6_TR25108/c0_g1_i1/m.34509/K16726/ANKRD17, MASK; ankyrin repeat domain-containing protein 17